MAQSNFRAGLLLTLSFGLALGAAGVAGAAERPHDVMSAFRSDEELLRYLKKVRRTPPPAPSPMAMDGAASAVPPPPPPAPLSTVTSQQAKSADDSITNTQEAGVDEGDIVKARGDLLIILRRGRLFTVSTRNGGLRPIDFIDAFPPGVNPRNDWYDEMLVTGNRVIVIGYSYGRGGTEINRFHIDGGGHLSFDDAYHLRSNDYYSSRNYASRLVGTKLIVYSPLYLPYGEVGNFDWLPGLRRWSGDARGGFMRIVSANHIYVPDNWRQRDEVQIDALHTVTSCDLTAPVLHCDATSVLGPTGRTFYVSSNAVYVWVSEPRWRRNDDENEQRGPTALVYRMPLDGSAPSAIGVHGAPTDQFSFQEDGAGGMLNVLVRSEGGGDAMWRPEFSDGAVSLLRLPIEAFGDGDDDAPWSAYRALPKPRGGGYAFQNRFVGDYVLYGNGTSWGAPQNRMGGLVVASVKGRGVSELSLPHGIDRIEPMGGDAVVIGADAQDLHFQAVELTAGRRPLIGDDYVLPGAAQGETRSHAFFFKPEPRQGWWGEEGSDGVFGLPVARAGRPGYHQLTQGSASMLFVRRENRRFSKLGEIEANATSVRDDACQASCVDWYGNARPIFLRDRMFALMGYELVEGDIGRRSVRETRRINFAPPDRRARPLD
ncbi:MAG: hypothetical protein GC190_03125 [Alphaproteobacteria bacterium]|nr:hypothetical protein [Alphaproteobacteria bacterium]